MFKSKIEVREFAVKQAVSLLGAGTPQKDVIEKAKEIEEYIIGGSELPEVYNGMNEVNDIVNNALQVLDGVFCQEFFEEEKTTKKK